MDDVAKYGEAYTPVNIGIRTITVADMTGTAL